MSAKHCGKHDITYPEGGECWCCEEQKLNATPGGREAAYRNPEFLAKRGGASQKQAAQSVVIDRISQLSPDQLERLLSLAGAVSSGAAPPPSSGAGTRTVIA